MNTVSGHHAPQGWGAFKGCDSRCLCERRGRSGKDDHSVETIAKKEGRRGEMGRWSVVANVFRAAAEVVGLPWWLGRVGMQW